MLMNPINEPFFFLLGVTKPIVCLKKVPSVNSVFCPTVIMIFHQQPLILYYFYGCKKGA